MTDEPNKGDLPADPPSDPPADPPEAPPADPPADPEPPVDPPTWRDDWREAMSDGDDKALKRLGRFQSPAGVAKSLMAAEGRIRSGDTRDPFPDKGTDEEKAAWRKEAGLPETRAGYIESLTKDIPDSDMPALEHFAQGWHDRNLSAEGFGAAVELYYGLLDHVGEQVETQDAQRKQNTEDELRNDWGSKYREIDASVSNMLDRHMPEDAGLALRGARDESGALLWDNPAFRKGLAAMALEINPLNTIVPVGEDPGKGIDEEIESLQKMMGDLNGPYYTDPKDKNGETKHQVRYRQLVDAQDKIQERNRAA